MNQRYTKAWEASRAWDRAQRRGLQYVTRLAGTTDSIEDEAKRAYMNGYIDGFDSAMKIAGRNFKREGRTS